MALCARNWTAELDEIEKGLEGVPRSRVLDVRFEKLLSNPIEEMNRILDFLGLHRYSEFENAIEVLGLRYNPGSWCSSLTAEQISVVESIQSAYLSRLGYVS
jgi:hypothetical protein